ncbi:hypothetical protein FB451DRAFT_1549164 [Mycena latifolia]|nr:hypothetical protein FB451DRAFT_1549164 [Mycena latifolia]
MVRFSLSLLNHVALLAPSPHPSLAITPNWIQSDGRPLSSPYPAAYKSSAARWAELTALHAMRARGRQAHWRSSPPRRSTRCCMGEDVRWASGRSFIEQLAETFFLRRNSLGLRDERSGVIVQMTWFSLRFNADAHWCTPSMRILAGTTACNTPRSTMRPSPISYSFLSAFTPHAAAYLHNFGATFTGRPHHARCSARPAHTSINIIAVKVTQRAWRRVPLTPAYLSLTITPDRIRHHKDLPYHRRRCCVHLIDSLVGISCRERNCVALLSGRAHRPHPSRVRASKPGAPCWFDNVAIFAQRRGRLADADDSDRRTWVRVAGGRFLPRGFDPVVALAQPNAS